MLSFEARSACMRTGGRGLSGPWPLWSRVATALMRTAADFLHSIEPALTTSISNPAGEIRGCQLALAVACLLRRFWSARLSLKYLSFFVACMRRACQILPCYVFVMHCTAPSNADVCFTSSRIGPDGLGPHVLVNQLRATGLQHAMTSGIASEQCIGSSRTCIILERWILFGELLADCARDK